ncbi:MAG: YceD family protein [Bacteroidia bacterium]
MAHLQEFNVNFGRLKVGKHSFEYKVDDKFFAEYEQELIENCNTNTVLTIDKTRLNLMKFSFKISGSADFACDRCNEKRTYPLQGNFDILVKLQDEESTDDDIVFLSHDAYEYNIASLIYDFHILSIPFKKDCVHENHPTCLKIEELINNGSQPDNDVDDEEGDPRWNELRKLL